MKQWTVLATLLAVTACQPQQGAPTTAEADSATPVAATAPAASPKAASAKNYEFYLLSRTGQQVDDPRIVSTDNDHPCGPIDLVSVSSIPMNDPVFMPSYVVEFDAHGKELRKWGIPNEADVLAIDGNRLLFKSDPGYFWTDTSGALEKTETPIAQDDIRTAEGMFACPKLPTFQASGSEQCFKIKDVSGATRQLALEGTCS